MQKTSNEINLDEVKEEADNLKADFRSELPAIIGEMAFIFLPFIVIIIANLVTQKWDSLLQTSDWALASTLLFGQTLTKLVMGVASREHQFNYQMMGLLCASIVVFGLAPSVIVIAVFELGNQLSTSLIVIQFTLLALSIACFIMFGTMGQVLYANAYRFKIGKLLGLN